ncbi:MAG: DUF4347 domain-containing protein, partial [Planctomycetota bacterium]
MLAADAGAAAEPSTGSDIAASVSSQTVSVEAAADSLQTSRHLVLVDPEIAEDACFAESLATSDAEIILLDSERDAIDQITEILSTRRGLESLHLMSHGSSGQLRLSGQVVDSEVIANREGEIRRWSDAFADRADLLIYGCELAATAEGESFLARLREMTNLDIAASTD